jgi:hypothetical protein
VVAAGGAARIPGVTSQDVDGCISMVCWFVLKGWSGMTNFRSSMVPVGRDGVSGELEVSC